MNINRLHITLLDRIMATIIDRNAIINMDFLSLECQHQDAHDTRLVQTYEYRRHHTISDTSIHVPTKTRSRKKHLIAIRSPHTVISTLIKYTTWTPTLFPSPTFLPNDTPTDICRKHAKLHYVNRSAIRILRQIKRQLINIIGRHHTYTINHDINISQLRHAYHSARPRILSAP